jgi:3-oxoacyl-[acyl-carrier-protein] synthase III
MRMGSRNAEGAKFLMRETVTFGARTVHECAVQSGMPVDRIAVLASVQPRGFIPLAIAERLGLARECAVTSYADIAHVGACGPIFNLHKARSQGLLKPGTVIALYAQGAGFTRAAALLEM